MSVAEREESVMAWRRLSPPDSSVLASCSETCLSIRRAMKGAAAAQAGPGGAGRSQGQQALPLSPEALLQARINVLLTVDKEGGSPVSWPPLFFLAPACFPHRPTAAARLLRSPFLLAGAASSSTGDGGKEEEGQEAWLLAFMGGSMHAVEDVAEFFFGKGERAKQVAPLLCGMAMSPYSLPPELLECRMPWCLELSTTSRRLLDNARRGEHAEHPAQCTFHACASDSGAKALERVGITQQALLDSPRLLVEVHLLTRARRRCWCCPMTGRCCWAAPTRPRRLPPAWPTIRGSCRRVPGGQRRGGASAGSLPCVQQGQARGATRPCRAPADLRASARSPPWALYCPRLFHWLTSMSLPFPPLPSPLLGSKYTESDGRCHCCQAGVGVKLRTCGRCGTARYCSKECQSKDWPEHRRVQVLEGPPVGGSSALAMLTCPAAAACLVSPQPSSPLLPPAAGAARWPTARPACSARWRRR